MERLGLGGGPILHTSQLTTPHGRRPTAEADRNN